MKQSTILLLASAALGISRFDASAQPAVDSEFSPRERVMGDFQAKAPAVGAQIPEVTAFDSKGDRFSLSDRLKGRHAVLVFGCLT